MENLRTIREYIEHYASTACPNMSLDRMQICIREDWEDWCTPDIAFKIDLLAHAQKLVDKNIVNNRDFDPKEFIKANNIEQTAQNIMHQVDLLWQKLNRTEKEYSVWGGYDAYLSREQPEIYRQLTDMIVKYIRLEIEARKSYGQI